MAESYYEKICKEKKISIPLDARYLRQAIKLEVKTKRRKVVAK